MAEILWHPPLDKHSALKRFLDETGHLSYSDLWDWSTTELEAFWATVWRFCDVLGTYDHVLSHREMPGASWFEGSRLSFAEHALRRNGGIIGLSETRGRVELTATELRVQVGRCRAGLQRLGVVKGDRVAAYLPNIPETVVAFLATNSIGAIWTSCAPEFGTQAVVDRLQQVRPKVLLAVDGYSYGGRVRDRRDELVAIVASLPSVEHVVNIPYLRPSNDWDSLLAESGELCFERVEPSHPLFVLYSSGTTGMPKPIVHGTAGVLLEHLKVLTLHADLGPEDRFSWFTTTGWMMWNYLVSGLLTGATIVLFDGDPAYPSLNRLWQLCEDESLTWFGASAPFLMACRDAGLAPGAEHDLSSLRAVGSTGAPLPGEGFHWVYEAVKPDVMLTSISGGTDVCTAFMGMTPGVPIREGEISVPYLGCAVDTIDGELVITEPMPSMPVGFWGDNDGSRYRQAYFDANPGAWTHGDLVERTEDGGYVIIGRSDATLNRGGVRVGTAEIYRVVESIHGIADSVVVHVEDGDRLVLCVVADHDPTDEVREALRRCLSPRHVPDEVYMVRAIPTTLSGKKLEVPIKRILAGEDSEVVASRDVLRDPSALDAFTEIANARRSP